MEDERTDLFLSHDWGKNHKNHEKVKTINEALRKLGYVTWIDEERLKNDIRAEMAQGILNSKCFIAFITKNYHDKVVSGPDQDNCKGEFNFASITTPIVPVILEESMRNTCDWKGNVGFTLATKLYIDISGDVNDTKYLATKVEALAQILKSRKIFPSADNNRIGNDGE